MTERVIFNGLLLHGHRMAFASQPPHDGGHLVLMSSEQLKAVEDAGQKLSVVEPVRDDGYNFWIAEWSK